MTAGLEHAGGDVVAVIDADLQDPPEAIADMVDRWRGGVDVAYGVRSSRRGESASKRALSRAYYRLMNRLSEVPVPLDTGDFRLMDRRVVDALLTMPEQSRYVRGMVAWTGFRQEPVYFDRAPRLAGRTKYSLGRMVRLATDGILSFSVIPLRLATYLGFAASALALIGIVYALVLRLLTDVWVTGWTLLFIAMLFLGGVQLLVLGVIGEYLGRAYGELKRRPSTSSRRNSASRPANRRMRHTAKQPRSPRTGHATRTHANSISRRVGDLCRRRQCRGALDILRSVQRRSRSADPEGDCRRGGQPKAIDEQRLVAGSGRMCKTAGLESAFRREGGSAPCSKKPAMYWRSK